MVKKRVIDYLSVVANAHLEMEFQLANTPTRKENVKRRIADLKSFISKIDALNFTSNVENVKDCLSKYGTFCDRTNFYYNKTLELVNDKQLSEIVSCEFFNSQQDYYTTSLKITKAGQNQVLCNTLLAMFHIGIVKVKQPYAQSLRSTLWEEFTRLSVHKDYIIFPVNENATKYLGDRILIDSKLYNRCELEGKTPNQLYIYRVSAGKMHVLQYGISYNSYNESFDYYAIKDENQNMIRVSGHSQIVKDYLTSIKIAKALSY